MNYTTSSTISGAASGAAAGSVGGPWGALAGGVIGAGLGYWSGSNTDAQVDNKAAWDKYNADMSYDTSMNNILLSSMIAGVNVFGNMSAARLQSSEYQKVAQFNKQVVTQTIGYNNLLLSEEEALMWEAAELDLDILHRQRAIERGDMIADMAGSGTVIGEGSNKQLIVDQMAQEELDAFVVRHGADIQAAKVQNKRAQNIWEGEMQVAEIQWTADMKSAMVMNQASISGYSTLGTAALSGMVGIENAKTQYQSDLYGMSFNASATSADATNSLTSGLFSAGSQAADSYYRSKTPDPGYGSLLGEN